LTVLKDRIRELRPVYLPPDPASRTAYAAGEVAQCDLWFPAITLPVGFGQTRSSSRLPVLVMVCGYARWLSARLIPSRVAEDLFAGWWQLLSQLGAVPRVLVWDGEGAVGQRRRRQTVLTEAAHGFRGVLGAKILICDPGDPEAKGLVERANGYLETSFLPGRSFASPADFNAQLAGWLELVNQRPRRVLGCAPADRIQADRAAMLRLPPVAPVTGWHSSLRLPRDHYVRLDSNDYSVHPAGSAAVSRSAPTWTESRRSVTGGWSLTIRAAGHATRRSATPLTWRPPPSCVATGPCSAERSAATPTRSRFAAWPTTTPPSAWTTVRGWPDGDHHRQAHPGPGRRAGLPDPGAEGAHPAHLGGPAGRTGQS
jgi:transposase